MLLTLSMFSIGAQGQIKSIDKGPIAFVNVNVIPMDRERVLKDQTVVIRNGVISEIGDAKKVSVPPGARIISGAGKFLIPGLTDMHVHLMSDEESFLTP